MAREGRGGLFFYPFVRPFLFQPKPVFIRLLHSVKDHQKRKLTAVFRNKIPLGQMGSVSQGEHYRKQRIKCRKTKSIYIKSVRSRNLSD